MQSNKEDTKQLLENVRAAYRFLYQYQRRIMDLIAYIGTRYGFTIDYGRPIETSFASKSTNPMGGNRAWDYLSAYNHLYVFNQEALKTGERFHLCVSVYTDTGFYDSNHPTKHMTRLETFEPIGSSQSHVYLTLKNWNRSMKPVPFQRAEGDCIYDESEKGRFFSTRFMLADMTNEQSVLRVLSEFEVQAKSKGFDITPFR